MIPGNPCWFKSMYFDRITFAISLYVGNIINPCCCCLVTKLCVSLCNPMDCGPPGSSVHGISQARILEWVAIFFTNQSMLLLLSCFSHVWLCATPQTAAHQASLSTGFSRQESWSGLPFPSPNQSINRHKCTKFKIRIPNYYSAIFYQCFPWVFFFFFPFVLAVPHPLCGEGNGTPL